MLPCTFYILHCISPALYELLSFAQKQSPWHEVGLLCPCRPSTSSVFWHPWRPSSPCWRIVERALLCWKPPKDNSLSAPPQAHTSTTHMGTKHLECTLLVEWVWHRFNTPTVGWGKWFARICRVLIDLDFLEAHTRVRGWGSKPIALALARAVMHHTTGIRSLLLENWHHTAPSSDLYLAHLYDVGFCYPIGSAEDVTIKDATTAIGLHHTALWAWFIFCVSNLR